MGKDITAQIAGEADDSVLGAYNVRGPQSDEKALTLKSTLRPWLSVTLPSSKICSKIIETSFTIRSLVDAKERYGGKTHLVRLFQFIEQNDGWNTSQTLPKYVQGGFLIPYGFLLTASVNWPPSSNPTYPGGEPMSLEMVCRSWN